jgi:hypothetical protein
MRTPELYPGDMIEDSYIHLAFAFLKSIIFLAHRSPLTQTLSFPVLFALSPFLQIVLLILRLRTTWAA